jgi:hypothetical protein
MSSDWYSRRLNNNPQPQPSPLPPTAPSAPIPYNPNPNPQIPQEAFRAPESAVSASRCPGCGSGNYGKSAMAPEAKARCYDCGYPVVQSGSGVGKGITQQGGGAPTPARQIQSGGFSWAIGEKM